jgi:hypothetical protein
MFKPKEEETTLKAINNQIMILEKASEWEWIINWKDIPTYQVFQIWQCYLYLALALNLAKEKMNGWTWKMCFEWAINMLSSCGMKATSRALTIMEWYQKFRDKRGFKVNIPKKDLPPFVLISSEICSTIKQYARENLLESSIDFLFDYVHHTTLPQFVPDTVGRSKDEMGEDQYKLELKKNLKHFRLSKVTMQTIYRWMKALRFRYKMWRKGYYVDGHEKPSTVGYLWSFCECCLAYEMCMFCCVQITLEQTKELEEQGEIVKGSGYHYIDPLTNTNMVEFHVDTSEALLKLGIVGEFGGNILVIFPAGCKPLIVFGHDESIFKQFLMSKKAWTGPNGESNIVPKDDGLGVMISAFQSLEFGFGMPLTPDQLEEVNIIKRDWKYKGEKAAMEAGGLLVFNMSCENETSCLNLLYPT